MCGLSIVSDGDVEHAAAENSSDGGLCSEWNLNFACMCYRMAAGRRGGSLVMFLYSAFSLAVPRPFFAHCFSTAYDLSAKTPLHYRSIR